MAWLDEAVLVNYCHPDCIPLMNIMRLPESSAFELAGELAGKHPETTAFYRFADFENYYLLRKEQDAYLYARFVELGGKPEEEHPLSFVVEGSEYLWEWFGNGTKTVLPLREVEPCHISFTVGDSGAVFKRDGAVELLTTDGLRQLADRYGSLAEILQGTGCHYVEAQLWCDKYIK